MSKYRIAFLIWWTALVLFIAVVNYVVWDQLPAATYDASFFAGWALIIFTFCSWIPGALLQRRGSGN